MSSILQTSIDYIPTIKEIGIRLNINVTPQIYYEVFGVALQERPYINWRRDKNSTKSGSPLGYLMSNKIVELLQSEKISILDDWKPFLDKVFPEVKFSHKSLNTYYFINKDKQTVMFINIYTIPTP